MKHPISLRALGVLCILAASLLPRAAAPQADRPNILFILASTRSRVPGGYATSSNNP